MLGRVGGLLAAAGEQASRPPRTPPAQPRASSPRLDGAGPARGPFALRARRICRATPREERSSTRGNEWGHGQARTAEMIPQEPTSRSDDRKHARRGRSGGAQGAEDVAGSRWACGARRSTLLRRQPDGRASTAPAAPGPTPDHRSTAEFCENGAKAVAEEATAAPRRPRLLRRALRSPTCRTHATTGWASRAGSPSRCTSRPAHDHYEPITWDEAFRLVAERLHGTGPPRTQAVFYTSGRTSQRGGVPLPAVRPRASAPTTCPTAPTCATSPSASALTQTIGDRQGHGLCSRTSTPADLIIVVGQNPGTNHPRMLTALEEAKRNGADDRRRQPAARGRAARASTTRRRREGLVGAAPTSPTHFLQVRLSGDLALLRGARQADRSRRGAVDQEFVAAHTDGLRRVRRAPRRRSTGTTVLAATGLDPRRDRARWRRATARPTASSSAGRWA